VEELLNSTLIHRVLRPEGPHAERHPALIMLHGRGADEEDLIDLARQYDPRFLVVSARAPMAYPSGGFTWYDVGTAGSPEPVTFRASCEKLWQFADDVIASYPVDPAYVFLLGFSMGTVMSYALSLSRPSLFRGVVAQSGYVPEGTHLEFRWGETGHMAYFISHGTDDDVIPVAFARRAKELFHGSPAAITYREYPGGHSIAEECLRDSAAFLHHMLARQ
jgi:phospholipase/carboxylesterase